MIDQVDGLLGQPLASVEGVDFRVEITESPHRKWHLHVAMIERSDGKETTRDIGGNGCAELAEAAAVAITMSIKAVGRVADQTTASQGMGKTSASNPNTEPTPVANRSSPRTDSAVPATSETGQIAVALSAIGDTGTLPHLGAGAELSVGLAFPRVRLIALGMILPSQDVHAAAGAAGSFQLVAGGALACLTVGDNLKILGCGGGEVGRLSGEGLVSNPRAGGTLWTAGRIELGGSLTIVPRLSALLRTGVVIPTSRPVFVVDGMTQVHQPRSVIARVTLGLGFDF